MTDASHADFVTARLSEHQAVIADLTNLTPAIAAMGQVLVAALRAGNKILVCGNGGSAGDAQHIAAELVCRFETERRGLPALALTTDSSAMTAISNDYGYQRVFARQVEALGSPGDVLIGISTSGTSANVVAAVETANDQGLITLGLAGRGGGTLQTIAQHCLTVPSDVTARIQECHILIGHIWCGQVDEAFTP